MSIFSISPLNIFPKDKITIGVQKDSRTPIAGSVIRISDIKTKDTLLSGITDGKGFFSNPLTPLLDANKKLRRDLVISVTSTSYEGKSVTLNNSLVPQAYIIQLKEKITQDDDIVIIAPRPRDKPRDKPRDNTNTETPTERLPTNTNQPVKSKKWLYVGLGAAALGLAVFVIIKATKSTTI